jgi:hypothetical protein
MKKVIFLIMLLVNTSILSEETPETKVREFSGAFSLNEQLHIRFSFYLSNENDSNGFERSYLHLSPEGSKSSCRFLVRRFELPHPFNRSRSGTLFSNRSEECILEKREEHAKIINSITLLDMNFTISEDFVIEGDVGLRGLKVDYTADLHPQ